LPEREKNINPSRGLGRKSQLIATTKGGVKTAGPRERREAATRGRKKRASKKNKLERSARGEKEVERCARPANLTGVGTKTFIWIKDTVVNNREGTRALKVERAGKGDGSHKKKGKWFPWAIPSGGGRVSMF